MTELIWEGKYNKEGQRVAPLRVSLPFQTVETVNESAQQRQEALDLFGRGRDSGWRNRLIWGDKKYVLPSLLDEFAGKVDLIYIDPPFGTGQDFSYSVPINGEDFVKEPSMIEVKAYRDTWGLGLDSYLHWFNEMAIWLHDLLSQRGSLYVHLDTGVSHYVKAILDEVFGIANFRSEVAWKRTSGRKSQSQFGRVHDVLLLYTKSPSAQWNPPSIPQTSKSARGHDMISDPDGTVFRLSDLSGAGQGPSRMFGHKEIAPPRGRHWQYDQAGLDGLIQAGRIHFSAGGVPRLKTALDDLPGVSVTDVWTDIEPINAAAAERVGYPTQKPEALVRRIIEASSVEGDLILDCVCGSGTVAVVAEKLNRRWIAADLGRFAVHTARKRLLSVEGVRPFVVQNLGKYERQLWQAAEFGDAAEVRTRAYQHFILELYKATPLDGHMWLHGVKQARMVHVGTVDAPVTVGDVKQIAGELAKAVGTGRNAPTTKAVDVLGWDFAFDMNEQARQTAGKAGIDVRFWRIPREVLEKRAVEQGDIRFYELAALAVDITLARRKVKVSLTDFIMPLDDVPEEVQRAITDWSQWIDYWAVDWSNKGDAFHNEWQTYRTRKNPKLEKTVAHEYDAVGEYQVVVKVIDILGNDTTKTVTVVAG